MGTQLGPSPPKNTMLLKKKKFEPSGVGLDSGLKAQPKWDWEWTEHAQPV